MRVWLPLLLLCLPATAVGQPVDGTCPTGPPDALGELLGNLDDAVTRGCRPTPFGKALDDLRYQSEGEWAMTIARSRQTLRTSRDSLERSNAQARLWAAQQLLQAEAREQMGRTRGKAAIKQAWITPLDTLESAVAKNDRRLADLFRRSKNYTDAYSRFADETGGDNLDQFAALVELQRQVLALRQLREDQREINGILDGLLEADFTLKEGFHGTSRDGRWTVEVLSPGVDKPKVLKLKKSVGKSTSVVFVKLGAKPSVLRVRYEPSSATKGAVTVLGAEGGLEVSSGGVKLGGLAYLGKAEVTVGPINVSGYGGAAGLEVKFVDGRFKVQGAAVFGAGVEIDLLMTAELLATPLVAAAATPPAHLTADRQGNWYLTTPSSGTRKMSRGELQALMSTPWGCR